MSAADVRLDSPARERQALARLGAVAIPVLSVLAALGLWELISRTEVISQRDLPAMSTTVQALWSMVQTSVFWIAFGQTVRGWAIGLGLAAVLAIPIGISLGSSEFAASARRAASPAVGGSSRPAARGRAWSSSCPVTSW